MASRQPQRSICLAITGAVRNQQQCLQQVGRGISHRMRRSSSEISHDGRTHCCWQRHLLLLHLLWTPSPLAFTRIWRRQMVVLNQRWRQSRRRVWMTSLRSARTQREVFPSNEDTRLVRQLRGIRSSSSHWTCLTLGQNRFSSSRSLSRSKLGRWFNWTSGSMKR